MLVDGKPALVKFINGAPKLDKDGNIVYDEKHRPIIKYGRKHGRTYAVIVALAPDKIGWSQVCENEAYAIDEESGEEYLVHSRDRFNKDTGIFIAIGRARNCIIDNGQFGANQKTTVPGGLLVHLNEMKVRAARYFK